MNESITLNEVMNTGTGILARRRQSRPPCSAGGLVVINVVKKWSSTSQEFDVHYILKSPTCVFGQQGFAAIGNEAGVYDIALCIAQAYFALERELVYLYNQKGLYEIVDVLFCGYGAAQSKEFGKFVVVDFLTGVGNSGAKIRKIFENCGKMHILRM